MKVRRPGLLLTLLVSLLAVPLTAQVNDTYVIPVVGNTVGANNTRWATELHVFNPQAYPLTITMILLPSGGGQALEIEFDAAQNTTMYSENVLADVFEVEGTGALLVATFPEDNPGVPNDVLSRAFLVNTKTFNNASSGTFGQGVPGVWVGLQDYQSDGITAVANGVRNTGVIGLTGFRTNVGAVNLGDFSVTLRVSVYDDSGRTLQSNIPFTLPPQGHVQDRLPVEVNHGSVEFFVEDAYRDAVVFAYASVVDNRSGDAIYITPVLLASPRVVFPKTSRTTEIGTKIDISIARRIAATAKHLGKLTASAGGRLSS